MKKLSKYLAKRCKDGDREIEFQYIPKKIFQTWETLEVEPEMYATAQTWIEKNPSWEYFMYTPSERRQFIVDNFSEEVVAAYDKLVPGAYKADLWRYCILYINGGVYADINKVLITGLDELLSPDSTFTSILDRKLVDGKANQIFNAFIATKPKHPFMKQVIDLVVGNINTEYYGDNCLEPTGPGALSTAINSALNRDTKEYFSVGENSINGQVFTLWYFENSFTTNNAQKIRTIYTDKTTTLPCIRSRYVGAFARYIPQPSGLIDVAEFLKKDYALCWTVKRIYANEKNPPFSPEIKNACTDKLVKLFYRNKQNKIARKIVLRTIKEHRFSLNLLRKVIKFELLKPIFKLTKKIAVSRRSG